MWSWDRNEQQEIFLSFINFVRRWGYSLLKLVMTWQVVYEAVKETDVPRQSFVRSFAIATEKEREKEREEADLPLTPTKKFTSLSTFRIRCLLGIVEITQQTETVA